MTINLTHLTLGEDPIDSSILAHFALMDGFGLKKQGTRKWASMYTIIPIA